MSIDFDPAFEEVDRNVEPADLAVVRPSAGQLNAAPAAGAVAFPNVGSARETARAIPALIGDATQPIRP